jgi:glucose uptake protein
MYLPGDLSSALALMILSAVCWGSWANTYKGTKHYPFELFYWDYILGVVICTFAFAFTLGSSGEVGEPFLENLRNADSANLIHALVAGAIFNVANVLLVAAVDIAGLAVAFPIAIGIALTEGVVLSYALQPKGDVPFLAAGVALALVAVVLDGRAYRALSAGKAVPGDRQATRLGVVVSVASGVLMGAFAPFVTRAMTHGHTLTPYSVAAVFSMGALGCCFVVNVYLLRHPIRGAAVPFSGYWSATPRNHLLGVLGGIVWGIGGCFNFIAAGYVGVPISYSIGQSAPLIAALWGILAWREFASAPKRAWVFLGWMFACYVAAIAVIALAYKG